MTMPEALFIVREEARLRDSGWTFQDVHGSCVPTIVAHHPFLGSGTLSIGPETTDADLRLWTRTLP